MLAAEAVGPLRAAVFVQHRVHTVPVLALLHGPLALRPMNPYQLSQIPANFCSAHHGSGTIEAAPEPVITATCYIPVSARSSLVHNNSQQLKVIQRLFREHTLCIIKTRKHRAGRD